MERHVSDDEMVSLRGSRACAQRDSLIHRAQIHNEGRRDVMGTQENEAVVLRFVTEVIAGGDVSVIDEVLAPNYVNVAMGGADLAGVKSMVTATAPVLKGIRIDDVELVAEDGSVFARINYGMTLPGGSTTTRAPAYYHLVSGKIDVNDVMFDPDIMGIVGPLMAPQKVDPKLSCTWPSVGGPT